MFRRLKNLKFIGKNKNEVYVSMVLGAIGFLITVTWPVHGGDFHLLLITSPCFSIAFFCALNASRDIDNASPKEATLIRACVCLTWMSMLWLLLWPLSWMIMGTLDYFRVI